MGIMEPGLSFSLSDGKPLWDFRKQTGESVPLAIKAHGGKEIEARAVRIKDFFTDPGVNLTTHFGILQQMAQTMQASWVQEPAILHYNLDRTFVWKFGESYRLGEINYDLSGSKETMDREKMQRMASTNMIDSLRTILEAKPKWQRASEQFVDAQELVDSWDNLSQGEQNLDRFIMSIDDLVQPLNPEV